MIKEVEFKIWDRDFTLPVYFETFKDMDVIKVQETALNTLLQNKEWIDAALSSVQEYSKKALLEDKTNNKKDNVFSYVKPESLFIECVPNNPRVAIMCKYRYDLEHGLAIIFSNDGRVEVGLQDIIL